MRLFVSLIALTLAGVAFADSPLPVATTALATPSVPKVWVAPFFNGIAAQVGKVLITYDDIRRELAGVSNKLRQAGAPDEAYDTEMTKAYKQILTGLIDRELLIEDFNRRGYKLPPKEVDFEYARVLKETYNGKLSELVAQLQQEGLTLVDFKTRLGDNMKAQAIQGRFRRSLPAITPEQIKEYYESHSADFATSPSVKLAVITLKPLADEPAEVVKQTAADLRKQITEGADFADLARSHSTSDDAKNGGEWDYMALSDLAAPLQNAISSLKAGEVSQPVITDETKGVVMIIKVLARKSEDSTPLSIASPTIERILKINQGQSAYEKMIAELKTKTFIKIY